MSKFQISTHLDLVFWKNLILNCDRFLLPNNFNNACAQFGRCEQRTRGLLRCIAILLSSFFLNKMNKATTVALLQTVLSYIKAFDWTQHEVIKSHFMYLLFIPLILWTCNLGNVCALTCSKQRQRNCWMTSDEVKKKCSRNTMYGFIQLLLFICDVTISN